MRALVTGSTHGIGLACANRLRSEGHEVVDCSRHTKPPCEVGWPEDIDAFWDWCGPVDILVNNVGGGGRWGNQDPLKTKLSVWREVYQKNAGAAIQFAMNALPGMIEKGWGRVISITSIYGSEPGGRPWFNMAKAAEEMLMRNLALQGFRGVTFNCVAPGPLDIPGTGSDALEPSERALLAKAEDVAEVVGFLCSERAKIVNGAVIKCG